jgi:hypothetical protein
LEKAKFWFMVGVVAILAVFLFKTSAKFVPLQSYQAAAAMV